MKKQSLPLIIFGALVVILAIGLTLDPKAVPSPLIGKPAAQFSLPELYTQEPFSPTQLKGETWILNIWASWCVSCRQEHEVLVAFSQKNTTKIIGLNYKDTPDEAKAWLKEFGNPYQITIEDAQGRAGIDWGVYGVPETFVIDAQGIIRHKFTGPMTQQRVDKELLPLLAQIAQESTL
ncbi:thiol:disulfide interchange protein [Thiosulfatimonas sediminis]|uniref:Thiol:disulfide interchange protein n=1 Tax=Thiosulfatimonas sediminis TaxID=2675054 RepID=A0A6F8PXF8_9GAMM|nr:DsbE family thiol:disulfide interchange protein [Thiosulfatimonas sediminis]BBP46684.1 thiol:disulfide interchange protein [Thiosulfatimonas sediminis]